jgi:ATP-dependent helicase HrpA
VRLGGIDCAASYLHEPGDPRDGLTVTVPIYALNQVSEERCEWLVPGMLKDKVLALLQEPAPEARARAWCRCPSSRRLLRRGALRRRPPPRRAAEGQVRERTQLPVQRRLQAGAAAPHLFMNLRVVDEHGRQLGTGRDLAA